jgi:rSAM/selenodomain-associated transferase 1
MTPPTRIVIFAKAAVPGLVKTRLIPLLGADGAARLARQMLADTVAHATAAGFGRPELCAAPPCDHQSWAGQLPVGVRLADQGTGDLGARLDAAARRVIAGGERILLIGSDCPGLDGARLAAAAARLDTHDAVIYPALDGGYVLLGLARSDPSLFRDIAWSTDSVAATTMARIEALGWSLFVGETMRDIDDPADLAALQPAPVTPGEGTVRQSP